MRWGWAKWLGGTAALALVAGGGAIGGLATRPSPPKAHLSLGAHHRASSVSPPAPRPTTADPTTAAPTTSAPPTTAAITVPTTPPTTAPAPSTTTTTLAPPIDVGPSFPTQTFTPADPKNPQIAALAKRLGKVVAGDPGCLLVTQGSTALYQSDPDGLFQPGSTQKLLVAVAALDVLGPNYTFTTKVMAPAPPVDGKVGALWLVGGGDPVLEEPAFHTWWAGQPRYLGDPFTNVETLVDQVKAAGVKEVTGPVHGDDSRYDDVRLNPAWPAGTEADGDIAPMSALSFDMGYESWGTPAVVPADQASSAAAGFAQLLGGAGIPVADNPRGTDGTPPPGSVVIASISSPPLSQIVGAMLRPSDNQIAEDLTKELGYHVTGHGTTAAGLAVIREVDSRLGIPWNGTVMVDGSGLSPDDRTTCETILSAFYLTDRPGFTGLLGDLPVAGVSGTLFDRFTTAPFKGHLVAKTGNIQGADALVGQIEIGTPVRFAMVFNQPVSDFQLEEDEQAAVTAIAPYP